MPRQARVQTSTNVYHAILRGVNKQQIFEDEDDYRRFIDILRAQTVPEEDPVTGEAKPHCRIYACCLMGNHVHLLMQEVSETVGETMKRIASSYVCYYNHRYGRIGHIFQERFKSQSVFDWEYFVTLLRNIHQNPTKGHIVEDVDDYPWSCWQEYTDKADAPFCSTGTVLKRMPFLDLFYLPLSEGQEKDFIVIDVHHGRPIYTDKEVWQLLETLSDTTNATQFQALPRPQQKYYLHAAHEAGVGPRALARLTGVSYSIVQRATSGKVAYDNDTSSYVSEPALWDVLYATYLDDGKFEQYPEIKFDTGAHGLVRPTKWVGYSPL